jgi:hypothetical protein
MFAPLLSRYKSTGRGPCKNHQTEKVCSRLPCEAVGPSPPFALLPSPVRPEIYRNLALPIEV